MSPAMVRCLTAIYEGSTLIDDPSNGGLALRRGEDVASVRRKFVDRLTRQGMLEREATKSGWRYRISAKGRAEAAKLMAAAGRGRR